MAIKLIVPVIGPITQLFGENPEIYKKWGYAGHNGVDYGIPNGTPVGAAVSGTVAAVSFENGGYGNYGYSEAYDRGYREGVDKGRDDGHDRDQYDPRRQKWYREGDRGYNKRYGTREEYIAAYRQGFLRGYDEGYRQNGYRR